MYYSIVFYSTVHLTRQGIRAVSNSSSDLIPNEGRNRQIPEGIINYSIVLDLK